MLCLSKAAHIGATLFTDIRGHQVPIYFVTRCCIKGNGGIIVVANHDHEIVVSFAIIGDRIISTGCLPVVFQQSCLAYAADI